MRSVAPVRQPMALGLYLARLRRRKEVVIGLSLAKRIVELHGGRIRGESPGVGLGACF